MKLYRLIFLATILFPTLLIAQVSEEAQELYDQGKYAEAKPFLEKDYEENPSDASVNFMLGKVALTTGDLATAHQTLSLAKKRRYHDATLYLGKLYAMQYKFDAADKEFKRYQRLRRGNKDAMAELEKEREYADKLQRMISRTEDIQIIDSVVVQKNSFLTAYNLSATGGSLEWVHDFLGEEVQPSNDRAVAYINERETKVFFSRKAAEKGSSLYTMEEMLNNYGNEEIIPAPISTENDEAYPFVMPDGLTIYFASKGHESIGGYDIFASRYNLNSNTYLSPNQMNMPFNSPFNDYMMVIDEAKEVGWFASDRYQPEDSVCVYTFIPNEQVKLVRTEDTDSLINRAKISDIKDTWLENIDYTNLINKASAINNIEAKQQHDFVFIVNDNYTYHQLTDFRSFTAKELFEQAIEVKKEHEETEKELALKRAQYSDALDIDKSAIAMDILQLEKKVVETYDLWKTTRLRARNEEIDYIN